MRPYFLEVISNQREGVVATALRSALAACAPAYSLGARLRNYRFDNGHTPVFRAGVPVVSVGNLTTGGTGKTPVVAWIVHRLLQHGGRPAILSRGYGSLDGSENDEKRMLDQLCPGVPHLQGTDRSRLARRAIEEFEAEALVLDDGFQHRRLHRDLDIVLIDALNPWGYGATLPRGLLREPRSSLRRADLMMITRVDQSTSADISEIRREIARHCACPIAEAAFVPTQLVNTAGEPCEFRDLRGQRVGAFCGIGNPDGFRRTLQDAGFDVSAEAFRCFPDHHAYDARDAGALDLWADERQFGALITTRKDLVKFESLPMRHELWAVDMALEWRAGAEEIESALQAFVRKEINHIDSKNTK